MYFINILIYYCDNYLPKFWVDLSSNSRVIINFFLFWISVSYKLEKNVWIIEILQTVESSHFNWKTTLSVLFPILIASYCNIYATPPVSFFSKLHDFPISDILLYYCDNYLPKFWVDLSSNSGVIVAFFLFWITVSWNLVFWYSLSMWFVWSTSFYLGIPFKLSNNFSRDLLFFGYGALGYITNFRMYTQKAHLETKQTFSGQFCLCF